MYLLILFLLSLPFTLSYWPNLPLEPPFSFSPLLNFSGFANLFLYPFSSPSLVSLLFSVSASQLLFFLAHFHLALHNSVISIF